MIWVFTGLALPYDTKTRRSLRFWSFLRGSIEVPGPVRLHRDHDYALRLGRCVLLDIGDGLELTGWTRVPVRLGEGLSAGLTDRRLDEVSIVERPAFPSCKITKVRTEEEPWSPTLART